MAIEGSSIWSDTSEREQTRTSKSPETKHPTILPLILHHPSPYSTIESILFAEHLTPLHLQTHVNGQLFQGGVGDRVKHWDGVRCQVDPGFGDCYKVGGTKLLHIAWLKRLRHPSPLKKKSLVKLGFSSVWFVRLNKLWTIWLLGLELEKHNINN